MSSPIRIQVRLTPKELDALHRHPMASDPTAVASTPGRLSGDTLLIKRIVLEAIGMPLVDPHVLQSLAAARDAEAREEGRLQRLEDIRAAEWLGIL